MRRSSENVRLALVSAALVGVTGLGLYSCLNAMDDEQSDGSGIAGSGSSGYHGGYGSGFAGGGSSGGGGSSSGTHATPTSRGGFGSHGSGVS